MLVVVNNMYNWPSRLGLTTERCASADLLIFQQEMDRFLLAIHNLIFELGILDIRY